MSQSLFTRKWLQRTGGSDESIDSSSSSDQRYNAKSPSSRGGDGATLSVAEKPFGTTAAAAWSGPKLAQEIHDEFLVCKICLEGYKNPKCLNCLHTFCEQCIENHVDSETSYKKYSDYREFTCPLCRKRASLPVGGVRKLPDNFLVASLAEMVGRRRRSSQHPSCDVCQTIGRRQRKATAKCIDCAKLLCSNCAEMHRDMKVTSAHSIFDVEIEKEIECKKHQGEVVRFYCDPCDACVCVLCTFDEHRDHAISQFREAVVEHRHSVQALMGRCREKVDQHDAQIEALTKCEQTLLTVERAVHDTSIRFVQEIRSREKQLIEELQNIYGQKLMEAIRNKKQLVAQAETLRSTCSLTDVILLGKDFELLLLKKEVEEKLNACNSLELENLPSAVNKVVEFVVGSVDVGHIRDHDLPFPSNERNLRTNTQDTTKSDPIKDENIIQGSHEDPKTTTKPEMTNNPKSKDDNSSSSSSSDSDSDSDSDDDDETKTKDESKADVKETSVQTEEPDDSSSSSSSSSDSEDDDQTQMEERGTMTDSVETEERGVNTSTQ